MEYQTQSQFNEIMESLNNGQRKQAARQCVDYGFYASDLIDKAEECDYQDNFVFYEVLKDIAILAELAESMRNQ